MLVLVHSPLTGPLVWEPAEAELQHRGVRATIPDVADHPSGTGPFWRQHAGSVARTLRGAGDEPLVLVAHSGAGQLLPAIAAAVGSRVAGYVFVDAGIPEDGKSRLDQMREEDPESARELEAHLRSGGRFPEWTDEQLRDVVPADGLRRGLIEQLRPRPIEFFTEPIEVPAAWPEASCGYVRLSPPYDPVLARAVASGWPTRSLDAGHFHMLVDPRETVTAILELLDDLAG
jgi:pimeloyl-ACP methyl ester carboxylesterase